ncbi:unnamed protein product [Owenia fusiformis]|uniref:Uncharacterized protein n=1 Tax=Owenia fusiformis TaxID=6347 RepID=A0A8J1YAX1_OWEFU|nr:unnamed protein product [Owenia fusiformis]
MNGYLAIKYLGTLCLLIGISSGDRSSEFSPQNSIVFGPGLDPNFVVPARFFFIQLVDRNGENMTESIGEKPFKVEMSVASGDYVRIWTQVLDRHDGSYIVRFKMWKSLAYLTITITYNGQHVGESPFYLKGNVYHEQCFCPVPDFKEWYSTMKCQKSYKQIKNDLSIFSNIDMDIVSKEAVERFNQRGSHSLVHYAIINNKVYRKTYGEHVGFKMFSDATLLSLVRKVEIPDIELFVNLGDWPLEKRSEANNPLPIFSWCGSEGSKDIIMPTYDVTESTLETMGRVTLDLLSVQANTGPDWANKTEIAFWRGRDSRKERLELVRMSHKYPDLIDARLTNMFFFKHEEDLGELQKHISFFDFFKRKYQINIDGTVAAYRMPYLLAGNSVVLKQDSEYYEHFYKALKPYVHYIPIKADLSDLVEQIQWAKDHDEEAQQIGKNGQEFVRKNLMSNNVFCYYAALFKEYAKKLVSTPKVREGMELVEQPTEDSECNCKRKKKQAEKRDEL